MLGIVVVVYKSLDQTVGFIKNELSKIVIPHKTVIVNNAASNEESAIMAEACGASLVLFNQPINRDQDLFLISSEQNLGYAKGNNLGAKFLNDNYSIEFLLFSNNDIEISSNNVVVTLIEKINTDKEIGMIGPRIIGPDGMDQSPQKEISFMRYFAWNVFPFFKGKLKLLRNHDVKTEEVSAEGFCYWVSGCFFISRAVSFFNVGMFDEHTFLYGEESILAERMMQIRQYSYYVPEVCIIHHSGGTTNLHFNSEWINTESFQNMCYYYEAYKKINPFYIKILKALKKLLSHRILRDLHK